MNNAIFSGNYVILPQVKVLTFVPLEVKTGVELLYELAPDEEKFYAEGAEEVEEEIKKRKSK